MSNPKVRSKKSNVSNPSAIHHNVNDEQNDIPIDENRSMIPPPPVSSEFPKPDESFYQTCLLRLTDKIGDIIERKFQTFFERFPSVGNSESRHCSTCACFEYQEHIWPRQFDVLQRNNTMRVKQTSDYMTTARRGLSVKIPDKRECLARALQTNVVELVNDVIFKDSELPDCLLAEGCLTENESIRCRKYVDPKDQVRMLLSIIKGRDLSVLMSFFRLIKSHNKQLGLNIKEQYITNMKQGLNSPLCALCKLMQRVDLKYVADKLYENDLLDDGLYNIIFQTELPVGAQYEIWHQVINSLNVHCREGRDVRNILTDALVHEKHYYYLSEEIKGVIDKKHKLVCQCRIKLVASAPSSISSQVSSRSPPSSPSISDVTDSTNLETEPESSDIESLGSIQPSKKSRQQLSLRILERDRKTKRVGQQKHTYTIPVKRLSLKNDIQIL